MSEKVKLTREQAEAIETKKDTGSVAVAKHLEGWTWEENKCLNDLSMEHFVKALYIGYEVEETFEVGGWVKVNWRGRDEKPTIHKVRKVNKTFVIIDGEQVNTEPPTRIVEHATPEEIAEEKQRRWWAKHGRKVWELRESDLLYYDGEFKEVEEVSEFGAIMLSSERVYFPIKTINSKYSIACFAEDRKDINGGDIE